MPFQILSLSGGGFLGLYTVAVLASFEEKIKRPIADCFDLIAGTSVGGIIALGLALKIPAAKILHAFEENGTEIFSERPAPKSNLAKFAELRRSLYRPKYDGKALRKTIEDLVGVNTRIGDLIRATIIPSVNVTKGTPQFFKTPHHPTFERDLYLRVADVALAASAAPTFFPIAEIKDSLFVDGGLYANSPDYMALHEAEFFLKQKSDDISLLSIGTTTSKFSFSHENGRDLGISQWASGQKLIQATISSQQSITDYIMKQKLADRYFRIDEQQSKDQERDLGLDVATRAAQKTIRGLADASVQRVSSLPFITQALSNMAAPSIFFHTLE